jgi:hypothetical protein
MQLNSNIPSNFYFGLLHVSVPSENSSEFTVSPNSLSIQFSSHLLTAQWPTTKAAQNNYNTNYTNTHTHTHTNNTTQQSTKNWIYDLNFITSWLILILFLTLLVHLKICSVSLMIGA